MSLPPPSPSGAITTSMALDRAEFIRKSWKDATLAKLSEGWKALQTLAPTQARAVDQIADASVEAADQGILKLTELAISGIDGGRAKLSGKALAEADRVLGEMKGALQARQGVIDPASEKAFGVIRDALSLPLDKVVDPARRAVYEVLRENLRSGKVLKGVTDLYYQLDGTAKAVTSLLVAGAIAATQIPTYFKTTKTGFSVTVPPTLAVRTKKAGTFSVVDFSMDKKELTGLGARWGRAVGTGDLTVAAQYRKDPKSLIQSVQTTAAWKGKGGTGLTGGYQTDLTTQRASAGLTTSTPIPHTKATFRTDTGVTATAPVNIRSQRDIDLGLRARAEVSAPLSKTVDLSAYAQAEQSSLRRQGAAEGGLQVTGRFGEVETPVERRARREIERQARQTIRDRQRGNIRITARMTGPLPRMKALLQDPSIPALEPTSAAGSGPSTATLVVGGFALAGALGAAAWWFSGGSLRSPPSG